MPGHYILEAKKISKAFFFPKKNAILKEISLSLHPGESLAIMGPSGVGKSTLLHILGTLDSPCSGELTIAGKNPLRNNTAAIRNDHIGFIFQNFNLLPDYTVLENILMPAKIARKSTGEKSLARNRALSLLEQVSLPDYADRFAGLLSGGEKQRVAIARALCNDPDIILADEPSGNLDDTHSHAIHTLLLELTQSFQKALIVVTHNESLAKLCHKRFLLQDGHLLLSSS